MLSDQRLQEDEYEKHFYGICSTELSDDFTVLVKSTIKHRIKELESLVLEDREDKEAVRSQFSQLHDLYLEKMEAPLKKFRDTVSQIFHIPPNVPLYPDDCFKRDYSDEEVSKLEKEVEILTKDFLREKLFLQRCAEEKAVIEKLKPVYKATNVKLITLPQISKDSENIEKTKHLLEIRQDFLNYCLDVETPHVKDPKYPKDPRVKEEEYPKT